jgi:hypothetical protein
LVARKQKEENHVATNVAKNLDTIEINKCKIHKVCLLIDVITRYIYLRLRHGL